MTAELGLDGARLLRSLRTVRKGHFSENRSAIAVKIFDQRLNRSRIGSIFEAESNDGVSNDA